MKKQEYMYNLFEALREFDEDVRNEIIEDYEEHFAQGAESGKTEEQIVEELGSIDELIDDLREMTGKKKRDSKKYGQYAKDATKLFDEAVKGFSGFMGAMFGTITKGAEKVTDNVMDGAESFAKSFANEFENVSVKVASKTSEYAKEFTDNFRSAAEKNEQPVDAEVVTPDNFAFENCKKVVAETDCGNIEVTGNDSEKLDIKYENDGTPNQKLAFKFEVKEKGDTVYVSVKKQQSAANFFKSMACPDIVLKIAVPTTFEKLTAHTMSGNINVRDMKADRFEFNTMSGDVSLKNIELNSEMTGKTMSGDLVAKDINSKELSLGSISGDCKMCGNADKVKISTVSGDAEINVNGVKSVYVTTVSGDSEIRLSDATGFSAGVKTTSGDINMSFKDTKVNEARSGQYSFGDGSVSINASTVSGDIYIKA